MMWYYKEKKMCEVVHIVKVSSGYILVNVATGKNGVDNEFVWKERSAAVTWAEAQDYEVLT